MLTKLEKAEREDETVLGRLHLAAKVPAKLGPHPWIGIPQREVDDPAAKVPFQPSKPRDQPKNMQFRSSTSPHMAGTQVLSARPHLLGRRPVCILHCTALLYSLQNR